MEYIWIIALVYIIFKAVGSARRRDFPGGRLPEPGPRRGRPPVPDTGGDYAGLPHSRREQAGLGLDPDGPLSGPWSKPGGGQTGPDQDDYIAGPWGRGPQPRREDRSTMDTAPDAGGNPGEGPAKQPEEPPETGAERETAGERGRPRQISGPPPRDGGGEQTGQRAAAEGDEASAVPAAGQKDETVPRNRGTGEYCRGNFKKLFTPQNIGSGIILAELLGPRGGRGRRRR